LNPIDWLKAIYETFGVPYPRASLIAVSVLGAALFAGAWQLAAKQVEKEHKAPSAVVSSPSTGPATTSGDQSPANTGNGNSFTYENPAPQQSGKAPKPKKKE
jgi:hypothetical protein